jgi:para-nitrobenzyl esterase
LQSQSVATYQNEFNDPNAPMLFFSSISFPTGASHASELQYIFDVLETPVQSPGLTPAQEQLSKTMVRYWAEFARTGNPNSSETPPWPKYDSSDQFQSLHPSTPAASTGFAVDHKCAFWLFK